MPHLAQSLLGPYQISLDKRPLSGFRAGKVRALLAYLSVESHKPHPREQLMSLFWPEQTERHARQNLRQTLSRLHQALGSSAKHSPFIWATPETVQFKQKCDAFLDVTHFLTLSANLPNTATTQLLTNSTQQKLEEAVSLYRGEFLAGFSLANSAPFEEWLATKRNQMLQRMLSVLQRLAAHFTQQQMWGKARTLVERQLALDPWQEEAHCHLIQLLAWTGRRSAALTQYETCRRLLVDDLGVPLAVETERLYALLAADRLEQPESLTRTKETRTTTVEDVGYTAVKTFIGRQTELDKLNNLINTSQCRLITVTGPGGIGKSTLTRQLLQKSSSSWTGQIQFIDLAAAKTEKLLPRIQQVLHSPSAPLLLILDGFDDVLDQRSQLVKLLRKQPDLKILVTCRSRLNLSGEWVFRLNGLTFPGEQTSFDENSHEAIQFFLQTAARITTSTPIMSRSLPAVAAICRLLEGHPLGLELAAGWVRMLSCQEIAQRLAANDNLLHTKHADFPDRHRSLDALYAQTWQALSTTEQQSISNLAIFKSDFSATAAQQMTGIDLPSLLMLWDKSWLEQRENGRFRLSPLVRRFVAGQSKDSPTNAHQKFNCHYATMIANCLPALKGSGQQQAVQQINRERIHIEQMWQAVHTIGDEALTMQAAHALFHYYDMTGQYKTGEQQFNKAVQHDQQWDESLFGFLLVGRGWFAHQMRRRGEAMHLIQAGLNFLAHQGESAPMLIMPLGYQAAVLQAIGEYEMAQTKVDRSLELAHSNGDWSGASLALNVAGKIAYRRGEFETAYQLCQQSLSLKCIVQDEWGAAYCHNNLGDVASVTGDWFEAEQQYQAAQQIWQSLGNQRRSALVYIRLADLAQQQGNMSSARGHYLEARNIYSLKGDVLGVANICTRLGKLARHSQQYHEAQQFYHDGLKTAVSHQLTPKIVEILTEFGQLQLEQTQTIQSSTSPLSVETKSTSDNTDRHVNNILIHFSQSIQQMAYPPIESELAAAATTVLQRLPMMRT